jgi:hypothetical protein
MNRKRIVLAVLLLAVGAGLAFTSFGGLAWLDSKGFRGDERQLRSRLDAYWNARVERNDEGMRPFQHPLQTTKAETGMLQTESYNVERLTVEGDEALATIHVVARLRHPLLGGKTREVTIEDSWVRYQDNWYRAITPVGYAETMRAVQGDWAPPTAPPVAPADASSPVSSATPVGGGDAQGD